jgi:hypothetical protein
MMAGRQLDTRARRNFLRAALLLWLAFLPVARAQELPVGLGVSTPTNVLTVGNSLVFTLRVTNLATFDLDGVLVSNSVPGAVTVQVLGTTRSQGTVVTNSNGVLFQLGQLVSGEIAQMTVTYRATTTGTLTNLTRVTTLFTTNAVTTNTLVQVVPLSGDIAVGLTPPVAPVLRGDVVSFTLLATNAGTTTASSAVLTNGGLERFRVLGVTPAGTAYTFTNGALRFELGTLTGGTGRVFTVSAQPTNAGPVTFTAGVTAANISEANTSNNLATAGFVVEDLVLGELLATNAGTMALNRQTGLLEQRVRLVNVGSNLVAAARVLVAGLTNHLYNAIGTNEGRPFVACLVPLAPGDVTELLLEFVASNRTAFPVPDSAYTAVPTSVPDLGAPSVPAPNLTRIISLGPNGVLIEFAAVLNRSYTVFYSTNADFSGAQPAQPAVVATGDRVQWIDNGPPKTASHPSTTGERYYRVRLNP